MNLSFRDLEYFLALVEYGHMGRAAAAHGVTQPALSKSLRRLEGETGLALFERSTRQLRLTASGLAFVEHARKLHAQYQDALRHTSALQAGQAGFLRIGATGMTLDRVVTPALAWLMPRRPALKVTITIGLSDDLFDLLVRGRLDAVVAPMYDEQVNELEHYVLQQDNMQIVASTAHPLFKKAKPVLADTQDFNWILPFSNASARVALSRLFVLQGLPEPNMAMEVPLISPGVLDIVASTDLISFAPEPLVTHFGNARVAPLPFTLPVNRKICLFTREGSVWTPLMDAFRSAVSDP